MKLDPNTTVGRLLVAIPSSSAVFDKFGIHTDGDKQKTLQQVCRECGIRFEEFIRALNDINWDDEYSTRDSVPGSTTPGANNQP